MKIWKILIGVAVFVCVNVAAMADNAYIRPGYDLRNVKEFRVTQIQNENRKPWKNFYQNKDAEDEVMQALYQVSTKKKKIVQDNRNAAEPVRDNVTDTAPTAVELHITIKLYGYATGKREGYYREYTEMKKFVYYDKYGNKQIGSKPEKKVKWVAGGTWTESYMKIKYDAYDIHTGELIGSLLENEVSSGFSSAWESGDLRRSTEHVFDRLCKKA